MCVEVPQGTEVMIFSHFKYSSFEIIHISTGAKQKIQQKLLWHITVLMHSHISLQSKQQVISHLHPHRMSTG
jgi:hypothetical protein